MEARRPYLHALSQAMAARFTVVNLGADRKHGMWDSFRKLFRADIFYYNWIENARSVRQIALFCVFALTLKVLRKKLVWTHHNALPHWGDARFGRTWIWLLSRLSDVVVIHTRESLPLLGLGGENPRVLSYFHPPFAQELAPERDVRREYDLLIWGAMRPSKGVEEFLAFLKRAGKLDTVRVKIVGQFAGASGARTFERWLTEFRGAGIEIENRFVSPAELDELHRKSRFVFFAYTGESVLNSGALMTSLHRGTPIIGPRVGAFQELGQSGLIQLYSRFEDVLALVASRDDTTAIYPRERIERFLKSHSWDGFSKALAERLS
jgi:glycosyltransferase involved in cell wall biosynthesis